MIEINPKSIYFHPGVLIKDSIEEMGLSQSEFAMRSGLSIKNVSTLLAGESNVTIEVAKKLSAFFHTGIQVWLNMQQMYDLYLDRKKEKEELAKEWEIAKLVDKSFAKNILKVEIDFKDKQKTIFDLRMSFNVGTLMALKQPDLYAFYKTSISKDLADKNIILRNAWISAAEQEAKKKTCSEFNKQVILDNLLTLRKLTLERPQAFHRELEEIFSKAGIKLVILPYLKNSLVSGVTKWIAKDNCVMIAVNDCGKVADKFWFSLFHELGHAMKNHKRHLTISYEKKNILDQDEIDANKFASDLLINPEDYKEFVIRKEFDELSIRKFAKKEQVAPFIVVGRLKNDKLVDYDDFQYLKPKYEVLVY